MSIILPLNIFTGVIGLLYLPLAIGILYDLPHDHNLPVFLTILSFLIVLSVCIIVLGALSNTRWRPNTTVAIFMIIAGIMAILVIPVIGLVIGPLAIVSGALEGSASMNKHIVI